MTTVHAERAAAPTTAPAGAPRVLRDVVRSWRAETSRIVRWPAAWVVAASWLALSAVFAYLFPYLSFRSGGSGVGPQQQSSPASLLADVLPAGLPGALLQGTPAFGGALVLVLGAMVAGQGYGWGTVKTVLTQGPSRTATAAGSLLALATVVVVIVLATLLLDVALSVGLALAEGASTALPAFGALAEAVGVAVLVMGMWALAGHALGTLARSTALSVGLGLVWALVLENLLRGTGALLDVVERLTHVLPGTAAGSLVGATTGADGTPGVLDVLDGPRALATVVAWAAAFVAASVLLVRRRDVT